VHRWICLGVDGDDKFALSAQQLVNTEILNVAAVREIYFLVFLVQAAGHLLPQIQRGPSRRAGGAINVTRIIKPVA